jgi:hypothetical protein
MPKPKPMLALVLALASQISLEARAAVPAPLDCSFPEVPVIPDGRTASEAEMAATRAHVDDYLARMRGSLFCLDVVRRRLFESGTPGQITQIDALTSSGMDEMRELSERFDAQVLAFDSDGEG